MHGVYDLWDLRWATTWSMSLELYIRLWYVLISSLHVLFLNWKWIRRGLDTALRVGFSSFKSLIVDQNKSHPWAPWGLNSQNQVFLQSLPSPRSINNRDVREQAEGNDWYWYFSIKMSYASFDGKTVSLSFTGAIFWNKIFFCINGWLSQNAQDPHSGKNLISTIQTPMMTFFAKKSSVDAKGPIKIYRVPRPGFGENLCLKKSVHPHFFTRK